MKTNKLVKFGYTQVLWNQHKCRKPSHRLDKIGQLSKLVARKSVANKPLTSLASLADLVHYAIAFGSRREIPGSRETSGSPEETTATQFEKALEYEIAFIRTLD